jgi:threonine/homoserine/homoserine lactone efflux protein
MAAIGILGLLTVVPGPDTAVVTRRALVAGSGDALRTVGGIATGLLLWGVLTAAGLAAVVAASPAAYLAVRILGAGYLVFLGAQALWQHRGTTSAVAVAETGPDAGSPWRTGLVGNALNPKIAVFCTGLVPRRPRLGCPLPGPWHSSASSTPSSPSPGWAATCSCSPRPCRFCTGHASTRAVGHTTRVVLIGFGLAVAGTAG